LGVFELEELPCCPLFGKEGNVEKQDEEIHLELLLVLFIDFVKEEIIRVQMILEDHKNSKKNQMECHPERSRRVAV